MENSNNNNDQLYEILKDTKIDKKEQTQKPFLDFVSSLFIILLCLTAIAVSFFYFNNKKNSIIEEKVDLQVKIENLEKEIKKKDEFSNNVNSLLKYAWVVDYIYSKEEKVSDIIRLLEYLLPENIIFKNGIDIKNFKNVKLSNLETDKLENISNFKTTFEKSGSFNLKWLNSISLSKTPIEEGSSVKNYQFTYELEYKGSKTKKSDLFLELTDKEKKDNLQKDKANQAILEKTITYLEKFKEKTWVYPCSNIEKFNNNFMYYLNVDGLSSDRTKEFSFMKDSLAKNNLADLFILNWILDKKDFNSIYNKKDFSSVYVVNRECNSYSLCSAKNSKEYGWSWTTLQALSKLEGTAQFKDDSNFLTYAWGNTSVYDENLCNFIK